MALTFTEKDTHWMNSELSHTWLSFAFCRRWASAMKLAIWITPIFCLFFAQKPPFLCVIFESFYRRQSFCFCAFGMTKFVLCDLPALVMHQTYACRYRFVSFCSFFFCFLIRFECLVFHMASSDKCTRERTDNQTNKRESTWKYAWYNGSASGYHK